ncbi:MAG: hypothetical protein HZA50_01545 [Planctomycetes bacterium]|nr:hypothetical protein [Planctomycetota bacterium]
MIGPLKAQQIGILAAFSAVLLAAPAFASLSAQSSTVALSETRVGASTFYSGSSCRDFAALSADSHRGYELAGQKIVSATIVHFKFDAWNRLAETRADSSGSPGDLIATYRYDGNNLRIRRIIEGDPSVAYDMYYDGYSLIETRKDASANPLEQYVMDISYVHAPVLRFRDTNTDGANIETLYYTLDANFNVTALVNASATVVERYTYDPYGKVSFFDGSWNSIGSSAYGNVVLYTCHKLDSETGLFYAGMRYYHPCRIDQNDPRFF